MSWNPGAEKAPLSFLLLWIVDCHVVIENDKQEERHAQHVGEDGELHVRDHPDQLNSYTTFLMKLYLLLPHMELSLKKKFSIQKLTPLPLRKSAR
jgi:hypothetical protein